MEIPKDKIKEFLSGTVLKLLNNFSESPDYRECFLGDRNLISYSFKDSAYFYLVETEKANTNFLNLLKVGEFWLYADRKYYSYFLKKGLILPVVSICIPVHVSRVSEFCRTVLSYWKKQVFINEDLYELIIVVNGDFEGNIYGTLEKSLKESGLNYDIVWSKEPNIGKARALSVGAASGELLLLVNDDTVPEEDLLYKHVTYQAFLWDERVAVIGTFLMHDSLIDTSLHRLIRDFGLDFPQNKFKPGSYKLNIFVTNNTSIKKSLVYSAGNFSPYFKKGAEDSKLGFDLLNTGVKFILIKDIKAYHYHKGYFDKLDQVYLNRGRTNFHLIESNNEFWKVLAISSIENELDDWKKFIPDFPVKEALIQMLKYECLYFKGIVDEAKDFCFFKHAFNRRFDYPRISVIMPAYNAEKTVYRAIESVISQDYPDFELIVVDDASNDNTWKKITRAANKYERLKVFRNSRRMGPSGTRNRAVREASGDYIVFLDADDVMLPGSLKLRALGILYSEADFLYTQYLVADYSAKKLFIKSTFVSDNFDYLVKAQIGGNVFPIGAVILEKDLIEKAGLFNESITYGEDYELWTRILLKLRPKVKFLPFPSYIYSVFDRRVLTSKPNLDPALLEVLKLLDEEGFLNSVEFVKKAILFLLSRNVVESTLKSIARLFIRLKALDQREARAVEKYLMRALGDQFLKVLKEEDK